jgi:hypothetical protein
MQLASMTATVVGNTGTVPPTDTDGGESDADAANTATTTTGGGEAGEAVAYVVSTSEYVPIVPIPGRSPAASTAFTVVGPKSSAAVAAHAHATHTSTIQMTPLHANVEGDDDDDDDDNGEEGLVLRVTPTLPAGGTRTNSRGLDLDEDLPPDAAEKRDKWC